LNNEEEGVFGLDGAEGTEGAADPPFSESVIKNIMYMNIIFLNFLISSRFFNYKRRVYKII